MARQPKAIPPELAMEIATTGDGRDITQPFIADLKQPRDPRLLRSIDWGFYDQIAKDDQVKSCMVQRHAAVVSAEWDVLSGEPGDARADAAADALKDMLARARWDATTRKMLTAIHNGYAVAELMWKPMQLAGQWMAGFTFKVRHARRFRYDKDDQLRLLTPDLRLGEVMPDRKFWVMTAGADNDDEPYGHGLADFLYWPVTFKRNGVRFWNLFLDKYAAPTAVGKYSRGTGPVEQAKLLGALQAIQRDAGIVIPSDATIELLQAAATSAASYEQMCRYMDEAIAKIILSQTMTTQDGSSMSQAKVHAGVKLELVKSDADLTTDSFEEPARWFTEINFGEDVAPPRVVRLVDEEEDLKAVAETDSVHARNGWRRTDESFVDTYGDGYERKEPVVDPQESEASEPAPNPGDPAANDDEGDGKNQERLASLAAIDPRPLYVYRRLRNAKALIEWAKAQGFTSTVPASEMHVTIAYSKRPVDWLDMGAVWGPDNGRMTVPEGGPRIVDRLGEKAVVLMFASNDLEWRNREMREKGASWDFPEYHPHVTISYDGAPDDLGAIMPFNGKLEFGPEIFEPLDTDWQDKVSEVSLAEGQNSDPIDEAVADILRAQGWRPLSPALKAAIDALDAAETEADFDAALLQALDKADEAAFSTMLQRAGFAVRIAAEVGADS